MLPITHPRTRLIAVLIFITSIVSISLAFNVKTTNVERQINSWKNYGCSCNSSARTYWYVFSEKMTAETKQRARYCGGSVLYIGKRNGYHLYIQSITVLCDSVFSVFENDSNFVNVLPLIAEEKVSSNIYRDSGLYYLDSMEIVFKANVVISKAQGEEINVNDLLKTCVDSIYGSGSNTFVIGNRSQMLCIANYSWVEFVFDIKKESPPTMDNSRRQSGVDTLHMQHLDLTTIPPDTGWNSQQMYTGKGITIAVCEGSDIDSNNLDFNESLDGTLTNLKLRRDTTSSAWSSPVIHKTHVAGIAAGSGWMSLYDTLTNQEVYRFRGVAPKALLRSESGLSYQLGDVNTHSDGDNSRWYSGQDFRLDNLIANHDTSADTSNNIEIFSAGNEGYTLRDWTGEAGYITIRRHAKNAIHVGSTQKYSNYRSLFSSMGPHRDGRIGPTVMAPGGGLSPTLDKYHIEIDYIRLRAQNGTIKKEWDFNDTRDGWSPGYYNNFHIDSLDNSLILDIAHGGSIVTDTLDPVIYADSSDLFEIRYRGDDRDLPFVDYKGIKRQIRIAFKWHDINHLISGNPMDIYKWSYPYEVHFPGVINDGWQEISAPLARAHQRTSDPQPVDYRVWPVPSVTPLPLARLAVAFVHSEILSSYSLENSRICKYVDMSGTSMSAPHVAGITALILQKYNEEILQPRNRAMGTNLNIHQHPLWPSTVRGMLIHTARDLVADDSTFFSVEARIRT